MTVSAADSKLIEEREYLLTNNEAGTIDYLMATIEEFMRSQGLKPALDDRSARFEAAFIRYMMESRE